MSRHDVIEISPGPKNLRAALADIDKKGWRVVSVVPNTGGTFLSLFGSGDVFSLLIVVEIP